MRGHRVHPGVPGVDARVVDDLLVDRAFVAQRRDSAMPLASIPTCRSLRTTSRCPGSGAVGTQLRGLPSHRAGIA